jgi:hypothetical protein
MDLIASRFETYPATSSAFGALRPLLNRCDEVRFSGRIGEKNNNQITLDFDDRLRDVLCGLGATEAELSLPEGVAKEYDFAFDFAGHRVAVEVEKANREKILYDILKCHMYLSGDAAFALLVLPKNYPHRHGEWNLFATGVNCYRQCLDYAFGTRETFDRILIVGYDQATADGERLTAQVRSRLIAGRSSVVTRSGA